MTTVVIIILSNHVLKSCLNLAHLVLHSLLHKYVICIASEALIGPSFGGVATNYKHIADYLWIFIKGHHILVKFLHFFSI